jgi:hypothetical protein
MRKTGKDNSRRKGKVILSIEIDSELRDKMHLAAYQEGMTLKEWFPDFLTEHLPKLQIVVSR